MELKKYTKEYTIRSYECDRNNNLRIVTLMNIFRIWQTLMLHSWGWDWTMS